MNNNNTVEEEINNINTTLEDINTDIGSINTEIDNLNDSLDTYPRPNLLENWYFVGGGSQQGYGYFPLNSNGQTVYNSAGYCIDQWRIWDSTSLTVNAGNITFSATSSNGLFQYFTKCPIPSGTAFTFSVLTSDGSLVTLSDVYAGADLSEVESTSWGGIRAMFSPTIGGYTNNVNVLVNSGSSVSLVAAKLEIGSTQTLAHQESGVWVLNEVPSYGEEYAETVMSRGMFIVETYINDNITAGANNQTISNFNSIAKTGYTVLGVVGMSIANATSGGANSHYCSIKAAFASNGGATLAIRNNGSSAAKVKAELYILYQKN